MQNLWNLTRDDVQKISAKLTQTGSQSPGDTPAGYTYFGQFVAHDIISRSTVTAGQKNREATPELNLDSVYPSVDTPAFEEMVSSNGKFRLSKSVGEAKAYDLFRPHAGQAAIPEHRNDVNIILSQFHLLWQRFHNCIVDTLGRPEKIIAFEVARNFVISVFHRILIDDYLQRVLHPQIYEHYFLRRGPSVLSLREFIENRKQIPREVSHAIFRFSHSMVRKKYRLREASLGVMLHEIFRKGQPLENKYEIDWKYFFDFGEDKDINYAAKIGLGMAGGGSRFDPKNNDASLFESAIENLIRSDIVAAKGLPSGGEILRAIVNQDIGSEASEITGIYSDISYRKLVNFDNSASFNGLVLSNGDLYSIDNAPLSLFVLLEAECLPVKDHLMTSGLPERDRNRLGPIASFVLAETLKASIDAAQYKLAELECGTTNEHGDCTRVLMQQISDHRRLMMTDVINFVNNNEK